MGWSIDILRPNLDKIFKRAGMKYDVQHPDALSPRVYITYDGDLPLPTMKFIINLFPDFVYVDMKKTTFPEDS